MENEFDLENLESFRINPEVWLHTLLAIVGDKDKKEEIVQRVAKQSGFSPERVERIIATAISILLSDTRAN